MSTYIKITVIRALLLSLVIETDLRDSDMHVIVHYFIYFLFFYLFVEGKNFLSLIFAYHTLLI